MKKKIIITVLSIILLIIGIHLFRILTAKVEVKLKSSRKVEVYDKVKISDLIENINGKIIEDNYLKTDTLGTQEVTFKYINNDNIKVKYTYKYKVVDTKEPLISKRSSITVTKGYTGKLEDYFFCGDNYDNEPDCIVKGDYNTDEVGTYQLEFIATDSSKNKSIQKFNLYVEDIVEKSENTEEVEESVIKLEDVIKEYKTKNNKIGIDISRWQGNIDFKKVKKAGIEFVMIRVGSEDSEGNFFVDPKFHEYIKACNKLNIPVGVYYYSYANTKTKAKKEAKWVLKQIKKYKIDLPVVFDWENWSNYREYNMSFHTLNEVSNTFLKEIEDNGYKGMLYSSKYYLENIWQNTKYSTWLAHYTNKTDYDGEYYIWQLCSNGKVDGIDDNLVDIDILYK